MGEVVINGTRLGMRNKAAAELAQRAAEIVEDAGDREFLTSPTAQLSLSFDVLSGEQAERVAQAVAAAAGELQRVYGPVGAPPEDVEVAAQLAAVGMLLGATYGVETSS